MFNYILIINLVDIKEGLKDVILSDLKTDVISVIFCLFKLSVRYNVDVETRDIDYILQLKQFFVNRCDNINFNALITFYIKTAIFSENRINLIIFLINKKIKLVKIIADINKRTAV